MLAHACASVGRNGPALLLHRIHFGSFLALLTCVVAFVTLDASLKVDLGNFRLQVTAAGVGRNIDAGSLPQEWNRIIGRIRLAARFGLPLETAP